MGLSTETIVPAHAGGWQQRLRCALADERFVLHFQPVASLASGEISHHEALLRLADMPDGRLVGPARFLAHAERSGLIRDIDRFVLDRVLGLLGEDFEGEPGAPGAIAVNLSARSITDGSLIAHLARELELRALVPGRLILELTETAAITDMAAARR